MYANDGDLDVDHIMERARERVLAQDRAIFAPILSCAEVFARENNMIVGGMIGAYTLIQGNADIPRITERIEPEAWTLELFHQDIGAKMRECLHYLYTHLAQTREYTGNRNTLVLTSIIPGRQYRILCDYRAVIIGNSLGTRLNIVIDEHVIRPIRAKGPYSGQELLFMPRDVQIMYICGILCDPMRVKTWGEWIKLLEQLFAKKDGSRNKMEISRGRDSAQAMDTSILSRDMNAILVGERAIATHMGEKVTTSMRTQYICAFDDIDEWITSHNYRAQYVDVRSPTDPRIRKMIVHDDSRKSLVADLFNITSYMPVAVSDKTVDGVPCGSYMVILYILFIDIWALRLIAEGSSDPAIRASMSSRVDYLVALGSRFFTWVMSRDASEVFPRKYVGVWTPMTKFLMMAKRDKKIEAPISALSDRELRELRANIIAQIDNV